MVQELVYCERDGIVVKTLGGREKTCERETDRQLRPLTSIHCVLHRPQASYLWTHYMCSLLTTAFFVSPHAPRLGPTPLTQSFIPCGPSCPQPHPCPCGHAPLPQQGKACSPQRPSPPGLRLRRVPFVATPPAPLPSRRAPCRWAGLGGTWSRVTLKARGADLLRNTHPNL